MLKFIPKLFPTIHILSRLGCIFSLFLLMPAIISYVYMDGLIKVHIISAIVAFVSSFISLILTKPFKRELHTKDGFALAVGLWLCFAMVAAVPFYLSVPDITVIDAFFEAMSGLTTTGATIIPSLDTLAPSLNFWRHLLNWLGGLGILILAVAILPMLGVGGMQLFRSEISGINKGKKLAPRITQTAKSMWIIYIVFTIFIFLALKAAGMSWFDALCHAMSCIALGGFSTHNNSIAYFDSQAIELILMFGMLLGAISFTNHFACFQNKSLKVYWKDLEVRSSAYILSICVIASVIYLWKSDIYTLPESLRNVTFSFISIGTACGYTTADFGQWPLTISLQMFLLANVLANSGSTGGGVKMIRVLVLMQFMLREMMLLLHPHSVRTVKINGLNIPERTALTVIAFIFVYFFSVVLFTFIMMFMGFDFVSALSMVVSCITNTGPALGVASPAQTSWIDFDVMTKIICSFIMLLGRLEVVTVFILFTPAYWQK